MLAAIQSSAACKGNRARAEVRSRASRTDKGVHALASAVCIQTTTEFGPDHDCDAVVPETEREAAWLASVKSCLPGQLEVVRCFPLLDPEFNARFACQKREYWYYVPYEALLQPRELKAIAAESASSPPEEEDGDGCWVWLCGLPDSYAVETLQETLGELLGASLRLCEVSRMEDTAGAAKVRFASGADANAACTLIDGAPGLADAEGVRGPLLALPELVASRWRAAHVRLRGALKSLTGTRSFHNFSTGFSGADDPKAVRSVYRCRSGITSGESDRRAGRAFAVLRITGRDFLYRQIRCMVGIVVAVARGSLPEVYLHLALSNTVGVDVPCAPAENLVLAECVFRDGAFAPPWGAKARVEISARGGYCGLSPAAEAGASRGIRDKVVDEVCSEVSRRAMTRFLRELDVVLAPQMNRALLEQSYACG